VTPDLKVRPTIIYLHGFASSAQSTKARYFQERLNERGLTLVCPDFNGPDFRTMTMTRMLEQLEQAIPRRRAEETDRASARQGRPPSDDPVTLIGSSLGGTLAILAAERFGRRVDRVVLMAPAVMFAKPGHHILPPERIDQWRRKGSLPFFHYAFGEDRELDFGFYEDSLRYDALAAAFNQPTLIFQGRHDRSVDPKTVEEFARGRSNAILSLLEDDHQLIASLPIMWDRMARFLGLDC
jgi:pimeloyl-ACP methyl ester carboxylesterase